MRWVCVGPGGKPKLLFFHAKAQINQSVLWTRDKKFDLLFQKEESREPTKEEKQAEAERLKKMQEEADLKLAKEAFGKKKRKTCPSNIQRF